MSKRVCLDCSGLGFHQLISPSGLLWKRWHCAHCDGIGKRTYSGPAALQKGSMQTAPVETVDDEDNAYGW
jgi:hypothetical protein